MARLGTGQSRLQITTEVIARLGTGQSRLQIATQVMARLGTGQSKLQIATEVTARLGTGQSRLQIATEVKDFISSKMCRQSLGYQDSLGIWAVRITTHLSPMLRLQMRAADPPLPLHALMVWIRTTLPSTRNGNGTHRMCRFDFYKCCGLLLGGPLGCTLDGVSGHSDSGRSCRRGYRQLRLYQDSCGWSRKVLGRLGRFKQLDVLSGGLLRGGYLK